MLHLPPSILPLQSLLFPCRVVLLPLWLLRLELDRLVQHLTCRGWNLWNPTDNLASRCHFRCDLSYSTTASTLPVPLPSTAKNSNWVAPSRSICHTLLLLDITRDSQVIQVQLLLSWICYLTRDWMFESIRRVYLQYMVRILMYPIKSLQYTEAQSIIMVLQPVTSKGALMWIDKHSVGQGSPFQRRRYS